MKKNIDYISLDIALTKWIYEKLMIENIATQNAKDLSTGLQQLIEGKVSSLMLDIEDTSFPAASNSYMEFGALTIEPKLRKVSREGKEIFLTPKEFDILYFLACNCGEVFTKKEIYQAVWEDDYMLDDSNIMAFIRKLRKKIEPNPDAPEYILTIWGIGYKFNENI